MSTIGVAGIERVATLVEPGAARRHARRRARFGQQGPRRARRADDLRLRARRGPRRVTPLFDALGHQTLWVGPVGAGTRLKVVNNTWLAFGAEAVDAWVALAHRLGLDTQTVVDALGAGPLVSRGSRPSSDASSTATSRRGSRCGSHSRTCGSPSRPPATAGSRRSPPGRRMATGRRRRDSATRTSPS